MAEEVEPQRDPVLVSLPDAAAFLDPPITLKTLRRAVAAAGLKPAGRRQQSIGRPAQLYDLTELYAVHARWVRGHETR